MSHLYLIPDKENKKTKAEMAFHSEYFSDICNKMKHLFLTMNLGCSKDQMLIYTVVIVKGQHFGLEY